MPSYEILKTLAAWGIWPALPLTGHLLMRGLHWSEARSELSGFTAFALHTSIGFAVWSFLFLALILTNHYSAVALGISGWILVMYSLLPAFQNTRWEIRGKKRDWGFLLILLIAATAYLGFPTESIYIGRDQGVYANHAIYIANHGRAEIPYPWPDQFRNLFESSWNQFPGFFIQPLSMVGQFPHLFPTWLAQAYASLGQGGLFRFSGILALLSAGIFYGISKLILPRVYALLAIFLFALNPAQIWLSRITLAEIFMQFAIWSGVLLFILALKSRNKSLARWAGVLFAYSAFIRQDSFAILPLLALAHLIHKFATKPTNEQGNQVWIALYQTALPVFALSFLYHVYVLPMYFVAHRGMVLPAMMTAGALLATLVFFSGRAVAFTRTVVSSRTFLTTFSTVVIGLAIFAYWVRPTLAPFHDFYGPPGGQNPSHREESLENLAQYLSLPLVMAAIFGWIAFFWEILRKRKNLNAIVLWVIVGGSGLIYLYDPHISPDHYWAIRRFVPLVIPGFILFAVYGFWQSLKVLRQPYKKIGEAFVFLLAVLFVTKQIFPIYGLAEYRGAFRQIEAFAKRLPNDIILADGYSMWITPLYVAFNKNVIPMDLTTERGFATLQKWIAVNQAQGRRTLILRDGRKMFQPLTEWEVDRVTLSHSFFERTVHPLPKSVAQESIPVSLYQIAERPSLLNHAFGAVPVATIQENGFSDPETDGTGPFRWTKGNATLAVPVDRAPRRLFVRFFTGTPNTALKILVDGFPVFAGTLTKGEGVKTFELPPLAEKNTVTIQLLSGTFRPANINWRSRDNRALGIAIRELVLTP